MVLSSLSRPLARSVGPIASRTRGLHTIVSPAAGSLRASTSRAVAGVASRQGVASRALLPTSSTASCRSNLGPSTTIRSLTGASREKVKVLLVLYDGGQHAIDVSLSNPYYFHLTSSASIYPLWSLGSLGSLGDPGSSQIHPHGCLPDDSSCSLSPMPNRRSEKAEIGNGRELHLQQKSLTRCGVKKETKSGERRLHSS